MRDSLAVVAVVAALAACTPDTAHVPIFLPGPYNTWPPAPPGTPIEPGRPVDLNGGQRKTIVAGVQKWMKDPASVKFGAMEAVRNNRGRITVCGEVSGRNTAGRQAGMSPFVGVLMGPGVDADFVLVGVGSSDSERAEVIQLCRASGIHGLS
jgi:hypothetical protein